MTHSITTIAPDNVPALTYDGKPVVTTAVLAQLYGAEQKHIQNNYKRNEPRFEHGKHFYKVEGSNLKDLKNKPSLRGLVGSRAKSLTLWTERGAARHAKMLETNQAWDIFEALEDHYFGPHQAKADIPALPNPLSPAHQRGIQKAITRRAQSLPKAIQRTAYSRIYSYLKDRFEVGSYKDIDESRYTEALAAVETVSLEGELLEAAMPAEAVEIDLPATKPWHKLRSHELYGNDIGYHSALSQLLKTLDACKEDGVPVRVKNIDGLKQEVLALRSSLENADERAWTDGELSHLYLVLHYVGLVNRDWHDYRLDEVLRNLESPARAMSESVKVASLYARNIAGHRGHQLLSARDRLGMSGNALLAI